MRTITTRHRKVKAAIDRQVSKSRHGKVDIDISQAQTVVHVCNNIYDANDDGTDWNSRREISANNEPG
jgi:hypothetical protein